VKVKDITIIGGGPAGLYAAFYAGMRDLSVRIIETKKTLGGKVHFYPEKMIWDVGGIPAALGADLIDQIVEQGMTFNPEVILGQKVTTFTQVEQGDSKLSLPTDINILVSALLLQLAVVYLIQSGCR